MKRIIALSLVGALGFTGLVQCHGNFLLTRKWDGFVSSIGNKWVRWIVFLLTSAIIPIYGLAVLVDVLILNSLEFWTGSNPIAESKFDGHGEYAFTERTDEGRAVFTYKRFGKELNIQVFKTDENGEERKASDLVLFKDRPGEFYVEESGELKLLTAKNFFDGAFFRVQVATEDGLRQDARLTAGDYAELKRVEDELQARYAQ